MRDFLLGPVDEGGGDRGRAEGSSSYDEDEGWGDEEDLIALKRRSVVQMEQNLLEDCDSSPIQPRSIIDRESGPLSTAKGVEKLLMERLLLRKELRLRSMQEKLLQQSQRLEEVEGRLREVESLPGFTSFLYLGGAASEARQLGGAGAGGLYRLARGAGRLLGQALMLLCYHLPLWLLHLLPPGVTIALANLAHQLSSLLAQRAENFSNECVEREENVIAAKEGSTRRRRRRS